MLVGVAVCQAVSHGFAILLSLRGVVPAASGGQNPQPIAALQQMQLMTRAYHLQVCYALLLRLKTASRVTHAAQVYGVRRVLILRRCFQK